VTQRFLFGKSVQIEKNDIGIHQLYIPKITRYHPCGTLIRHRFVSTEKTKHLFTTYKWSGYPIVARELMPKLKHPPSLSYLGHSIQLPPFRGKRRTFHACGASMAGMFSLRPLNQIQNLAVRSVRHFKN
jgi:hypothetical protein